jgi:hypothetical protein
MYFAVLTHKEKTVMVCAYWLIILFLMQFTGWKRKKDEDDNDEEEAMKLIMSKTKCIKMPKMRQISKIILVLFSLPSSKLH